MRILFTTLTFLISLTFHGCSQSVKESQPTEIEWDTVIQYTPSVHSLVSEFSRDSIAQKLQDKIANNHTRIIHIFVPLCDNDHQGIVPVNKPLGDGLNLRTNLYWGAGYGIKTHFNRSSTWDLVSSILNPNADILERVIFKHVTENVLLIADGYRGDRMISCLTDYFDALAGRSTDSISFMDSIIYLKSSIDLVVFNGHNGLMDERVEAPKNEDGIGKDAIAIACVSHSYFKDKINTSGGYPLVFTTNFLAPEAYVLHHIFDAWVAGKRPEDIRYAAAQGYHSIQKCGIRGASNLFVTGW